MSKVDIQNEIAKRRDAMGMTAPEITKRFTDLARGNMSDYLVKKQTEFTPKVKVDLNELILRLRNDVNGETALVDQPHPN